MQDKIYLRKSEKRKLLSVVTRGDSKGGKDPRKFKRETERDSPALATGQGSKDGNIQGMVSSMYHLMEGDIAEREEKLIHNGL